MFATFNFISQVLHGEEMEQEEDVYSWMATKQGESTKEQVENTSQI